MLSKTHNLVESMTYALDADFKRDVPAVASIPLFCLLKIYDNTNKLPK